MKKIVAVGPACFVNLWTIEHFHVAAPNGFGAVRNLRNTLLCRFLRGTFLMPGCEHDAKPGFAAHHAFVSLSRAFQREDFIH